MKLTLLNCFVVVIIIAACAPGLKTTSKTEKDVKLDNYKTYAWIAPHNPDDESRKDDKIYAPLIRRLCEEALAKKGLKVDTLHPDAVFAFDTRVEERVKYGRAAVSNATYFYGGSGYYPGYYVGSAYYDNNQVIPGGEVMPEEYDQGMLGIQMFDAQTKKVLWRGYAEKELTAKTDVEATIKKAVKDIFILLPIKHRQ